VTDRKEPRGWYVEDRIAEIKHALNNLEWEMMGAYFVGRRAEEMQIISQRLLNLADPKKGHTDLPEGMKAWEVKDAA
jgi:hypothetical protein